MHTNNAPSTVTRLKDMGIPTFLITATVESILAQRLVRRICTQCRDETEPTQDALSELSMTKDDIVGKQFFRGLGCDVCNNTGYKGRVGLFELMILNDRLREMIMSNSPDDALRESAKEFGMTPLRDAGMTCVHEGTTTIDEIVRETVLEV